MQESGASQTSPWMRKAASGTRARRQSPTVACVALAVLLLSAIDCVSTHEPSAPANAIHIGSVLPFSGQGAASGVELESALRLAIDVVNSAGGLAGQPLWLDVGDSHSDNSRGTNNALEIIDSSTVPFFIGPEEPTIAYQITNAIKAEHMVHLMPGLTSPNVHDPSAQAAWFRLSPSVKYLACALAKYMLKDGIATANLVIDPDDYSGTFATMFGQTFSTNGGTMLPSLQISATSQGFADIFTTLARYAPNATVLMTSPAVAAQFLQEWAVRGKPGKWYLGPTLNNPELLRNVPAGVLEGMKGISADLGARATDFAAYFQAQTAIPPLTGSNYYFDAVALLALAVNHGIAVHGAMPAPAALTMEMQAVTSASGEVVSFDQLAEGLALVKAGQAVQYQGAAGTYLLNSQGNSTQTRGAIWQITGTSFEDIDYEQCSTLDVVNDT